MIIGICHVCKGPVSNADPLVLFEGNLYRVSKSACDWHIQRIAAYDAQFLRTCRIEAI
jgi:hypothetical protein